MIINMLKKGLVVAVILLFLGAGVMPSTVGTIDKTTVYTNQMSGGYIQGLIDNASAGDTIYILSGIYYENIIINKSISLIGEDKNTTIIDGSNNGKVVSISADWVNISGFTIQNSGNRYSNYDSGLFLKSNNNTISNNIITDNSGGGGIYQFYEYISSGNIITGNTISNNNYGIHLLSSPHNIISGNTISNNGNGIILSIYTDNNSIEHNAFISNENSIFLYEAFSNRILKNNFVNNNQQQEYFKYWKIFNFDEYNIWSQNYWDRYRLLPKLIPGAFILMSGTWYQTEFFWLNIDWHPAKEPYDIKV